MPRITIVTDLGPDELLTAAERAAEAQGFRSEDGPGGELRVRKGDLAMSVLFGAFVLYANFALFVDETKKGDRRLSVEWETPWWTGFIGAGRTKTAAQKFADEVEYRIEKAGGKVRDRRES